MYRFQTEVVLAQNLSLRPTTSTLGNMNALITTTAAWRQTFPGGHVGALLISGVDNAPRATPLDDWKRTLLADLRTRYAGFTRADLLALDVLQAYRIHYKRFNKTYHVQLQLESVLHKGKSLPAVTPLVDAIFAAELETLLLSAGHDADRLAWPVTIDAAGAETYALLSGVQQQVKRGDMAMRDAEGVVCTIVYGQDARTPITAQTRRVLCVTYAPPGISATAVAGHHDAILANVRRFAPDAVLEQATSFSAV